jgi:hypothetical protein
LQLPFSNTSLLTDWISLFVDFSIQSTCIQFIATPTSS